MYKDRSMNIFIGFNENDDPISVLLAESREKADLVWMGMGVEPMHVEEIDPSSNIGSNGVCILLTSKKIKQQVGLGKDKTFNVFKRGK